MGTYNNLVKASKQQNSDEVTPHSKKPRRLDVEQSRRLDVSQASETTSAPDISSDGYLEAVRDIVRQVGTGNSPLRVTAAENDWLDDTVYAFKKRGIKTDKTQIIRSALNYIMHDHTVNGETSVLSKMLERLHS